MQAQLPDSNTRADRGSPGGTPRWVKVSGAVGIILIVLLIGLLLFTGGHGPGRHSPGGAPGDHTPPIEHNVRQPWL